MASSVRTAASGSTSASPYGQVVENLALAEVKSLSVLAARTAYLGLAANSITARTSGLSTRAEAKPGLPINGLGALGSIGGSMK